MRALALALLALALSGCETTAQRSAKLERAAQLHGLGARAAAVGVSVRRESAVVKVLRASVVRGAEGSAAVVTVRNDSARALQDLPIAIAMRDARGRTIADNSAPGLEAALVSIPSLAPHGVLSWVDDQISAAGAAGVSARVGEGSPAARPLPAIEVAGLHAVDDPTNGPGAEGTLRNRSPVAQHKLVVFVVARRGASTVAAGRAVVPALGAGASAPFQAFFIGDPRGAALEASAPASTPG